MIEGDHGSAYFHPDSAAAHDAIECLVTLQRERRLRDRPPAVPGAARCGVRGRRGLAPDGLRRRQQSTPRRRLHAQDVHGDDRGRARAGDRRRTHQVPTNSTRVFATSTGPPRGAGPSVTRSSRPRDEGANSGLMKAIDTGGAALGESANPNVRRPPRRAGRVLHIRARRRRGHVHRLRVRDRDDRDVPAVHARRHARSPPTAGCSSGRRTASSGSSRTDSVLPTPFIDLSAHVNTFDDRGFWGLAFDPDFATNGYVYLSYTYENARQPQLDGSADLAADACHGEPGEPRRRAARQRDGDPGQHRHPAVHRPPGRAPTASRPTAARTPSARCTSLPTARCSSASATAPTRRSPIRARCAPRTSTAPNGKILRINTDGSAPADNPFYDGNQLVALAGLAATASATRSGSRSIPVDRGDLLRRRRVEHLGGGQPRLPGHELRLALLRGQRAPQPPYQSQFTQCAQLAAERGHAAVLHLRPQRGLGGDRRARSTPARAYPHAVPRQLLLRRLLRQLHPAGRARRPAPARSRSSCSRRRRRRRCRSPRAPTGCSTTCRSRRARSAGSASTASSRDASATPDVRLLAADGGVLERRHDEPRRRHAVVRVGLRRRRDVDGRQPVAHVHERRTATTFTGAPDGHQHRPGTSSSTVTRSPSAASRRRRPSTLPVERHLGAPGPDDALTAARRPTPRTARCRPRRCSGRCCCTTTRTSTRSSAAPAPGQLRRREPRPDRHVLLRDHPDRDRQQRAAGEHERQRPGGQRHIAADGAGGSDRDRRGQRPR